MVLALTGDIDNRDEIIADQEAEIESLKAQLAHEKQSGREGARAVAALRKTLTPFYQSLQMLFGHMEAVGGPTSDQASATTTSPRVTAVWEEWKRHVGGQPAKLIDALLIHGELTSGQIATIIRVNPKNVAQVIHKLYKHALLNKNGGKFSLKQL